MEQVKRNKDDEFKVLLDKCQICNIGLVDAVDELVTEGMSVNKACDHYQRHQEQLHGEAAFSANALMQRYRTAKGIKTDKRQVEKNPVEKAVQSMILASKENDAMIQKTKIKEAKAAARKGGDNLTIEIELMDRFSQAVSEVQAVIFAMIYFKLGKWAVVLKVFSDGAVEARARKAAQAKKKKGKK